MMQGGLVASAGMALLVAAPSADVCAQVMQIDSDGSVQTFSGPTVFQGDRATPLAPAHAASRGMRAVSARHGVDLRPAATAARLSTDLIAAVAWRESRFRADAVSRRGALGEMQLTPATARALGVDPSNPGQNVMGGAAYLRRLMERYDGDLVRTLAAYNAGPAAVDRYGGVPPFKETQAYVAAVLNRLSQAVVPVSMEKTAQR